MGKTVMLFGTGAVGGFALQLLARSEGVDRIVASDKNEEEGVYKTNYAAMGAVFQGFSKRFEFRKNDVKDIDATAKLLEEIKPDVILLSLSIRSADILTRSTSYPPDIFEKFWTVGYGFQLPWHLLLPAKFMQALKKSGIQTHVINCSFPDVVGPALWKHFGFGPTVGMGNHDNRATLIIKYLSTVEEVPVRDIIIYFVGSHALVNLSDRKEKVPFFLKIQLGDRDITSKYNTEWLVRNRLVSVRVDNRDVSNQPTVKREEGAFFFGIASSAVKNIMAIIRDTNEFTHAPAPNGLIGGYPIRLSAKGAKVVLPKELTLEQAIKINEEAEKFDGIEKIKDDGTIVYTDKSYSIMKELGYNHKELPFDEVESRSEELEKLRIRLMK